MNRGRIIAGALAGLLTMPALSQSAPANPFQPPPHTAPWPELAIGKTQAERSRSYELSPELRRGLSAARCAPSSGARARWRLPRHRAGVAEPMSSPLRSIHPSSRVRREARGCSRRVTGAGAHVTLPDLTGPRRLPHGSICAAAGNQPPGTLIDVQRMLVLYTTVRDGGRLAYHYGDTGFACFHPQRCARRARGGGGAPGAHPLRLPLPACSCRHWQARTRRS